MSLTNLDAAWVYLVGAGPGDPGLLTQRGREVLEQCDCVIYDYLANNDILSYVPTNAKRIYVGKKAGTYYNTQEEINEGILNACKEFKKIVRLKGGDPLMFGRGGEEAIVLQEQGIPYEIVPGVTSGLAAATYAGIPLTHRDYNSSVVFLTGREKPGKARSNHDWAAIAGINTIVCYMGVGTLPTIVDHLLNNDRDSATPVALVQWATYDKQRVVVDRLDKIVETVKREKIGSPSIIIIGDVVACRDKMGWYDQRPLFGQRIMVTRSRKQQGELAACLRDAGATVLQNPSMRIEALEDFSEIDERIEEIAAYDWIAFTSANGVEHFFAALQRHKLDARALAHVRIAAVGPATSRALEECGIYADLLPQTYDGAQLGAELVSKGARRVLLPQADNARPELQKALSTAAIEVDALTCYRSVTEKMAAEEEWGHIDAVCFASSVTVDRFVEQCGKNRVQALEQEGVQFIAIGPQTASRLQEHGLICGAVAREPRIPALRDACIAALLK